MDPTPSSSPASPFDMVSGALADYIPRAGSTAAAVPVAAQSDSRADRLEGDGREAGGQEQILGAVNLDRDLRITSCNLDAAPFRGVSVKPGAIFTELLPPGDVPTVTQRLRNVVETREAHVARVQRLRRDDGTELVVSMSILPAAAPQGGLTVSLIAMARRLHLYASAAAIGTSLDIGETAQSLAQSLLAWGDVAAVDLDFAVWTGKPSPSRRTSASGCGGRPWCRSGPGPRDI